MKWWWWAVVVLWLLAAAGYSVQGDVTKEQAALLWAIVMLLAGRTKAL